MPSSIYPFDITGQLGTTPLFIPDIVITPAMVSPGGGGILRLWFSFEFGSAAVGVRVLRGKVDSFVPVFAGTLNPDNGSLCKSDGYYRFDIDVEADDIIQLEANQAVTANNLMRAHIVVFGA